MSERNVILVGGTKMVERHLKDGLPAEASLIVLKTMDQAMRRMGREPIAALVLGPTMRRALAMVTTIRRDSEHSNVKLIVVYRDDHRADVTRHLKGRYKADEYVMQSKASKELGAALTSALVLAAEPRTRTEHLAELPLDALSTLSEDVTHDAQEAATAIMNILDLPPEDEAEPEEGGATEMMDVIESLNAQASPASGGGDVLLEPFEEVEDLELLQDVLEDVVEPEQVLELQDGDIEALADDGAIELDDDLEILDVTDDAEPLVELTEVEDLTDEIDSLTELGSGDLETLGSGDLETLDDSEDAEINTGDLEPLDAPDVQELGTGELEALDGADVQELELQELPGEDVEDLEEVELLEDLEELDADLLIDASQEVTGIAIAANAAAADDETADTDDSGSGDGENAVNPAAEQRDDAGDTADDDDDDVQELTMDELHDIDADEIVEIAEDVVEVAQEPVQVAEEPVHVAEEPAQVAEEPVQVVEEPVQVTAAAVEVKPDAHTEPEPSAHEPPKRKRYTSAGFMASGLDELSELVTNLKIAASEIDRLEAENDELRERVEAFDAAAGTGDPDALAAAIAERDQAQEAAADAERRAAELAAEVEELRAQGVVAKAEHLRLQAALAARDSAASKAAEALTGIAAELVITDA